ncbi:hypothetical protein, partial [Klebsiella oxytoca]|uniref:hypothetical protein n=1 Tax=Klebsiella oxytoca TaxID=571 RepID=UPI0019548799
TYVKGLGLNPSEIRKAREMHIELTVFQGLSDKIDLTNLLVRANVAEHLARNFKVSSRDDRSRGREV